MSRLVVVSNRVAPLDEGKAAAGGLAVAVLAALRRRGGVWLGWSGEVDDTPEAPLRLHRSGKLTYAMLDLPQRDYDEYYNGFANSTLWPLFHYRIDLTNFSRQTYDAYRRVNNLFADRLTGLLQPDDTIWVHDYHLIPMGAALRERGVAQRIGFFLHIPFPTPEILLALPNHADLVKALCAYDLVGLHTERDVRALRSYLIEEAGGKAHGHRHVWAFGRLVRIEAFPIGIETADIERAAPAAAHSKATNQLVSSLVGRDLIIGVDRLDYSKGLPQRFRAFESLLEGFPERRSRVTFMQIAPPSRTGVAEYAEIRRQLERLAGHINGRFAEFDWGPIRYLNRSVARRTLLGFYRVARIGLVTPLRDGMNMVAKEYVAAQDMADPGVLVLSRFAGAAAELESALLVNPYDPQGVAEAMERGLSMSLEERVERQTALMAVLRANDISHWRDRFLAALAEPPPHDGATETSHAL